MTPQVIVGLVFVLIGIAIKVLQLAGLLGAGELGMIGEVSNLGFALLGKELWPGSPQSFAAKTRASKMPPPITPGAVLVVLAYLGCVALPACAATPAPREALEGAKRAQESLDRMCAELERTKAIREEVTDVLDQAANGAPVEPVLEQPAAPSPEGPAPADAPQ